MKEFTIVDSSVGHKFPAGQCSRKACGASALEQPAQGFQHVGVEVALEMPEDREAQTRIPDERPENPCHLGSDEGVYQEPESQQYPILGGALVSYRFHRTYDYADAGARGDSKEEDVEQLDERIMARCF